MALLISSLSIEEVCSFKHLRPILITNSQAKDKITTWIMIARTAMVRRVENWEAMNLWPLISKVFWRFAEWIKSHMFASTLPQMPLALTEPVPSHHLVIISDEWHQKRGSPIKTWYSQEKIYREASDIWISTMEKRMVSLTVDNGIGLNCLRTSYPKKNLSLIYYNVAYQSK